MGAGWVDGRFINPDRIVSIFKSGKNAVIVAPTGSGKTHGIITAGAKLIAEGFVEKVIVTEPTKAGVGEVVRKVTSLIGEDAIGRDDSDARLDPNWSFTKAWEKPFVATTYEKLDTILLSSPFTDMSRFLVVIDEAHQLTSEERATTLIDLMAYLKMYNAKVALLSATMPEVESLADYLGAEVYMHNTRPVKIDVHEVTVTSLGRGAFSYYQAKTNSLVEWIKKNNINIKDLTPVYVYIPSRRWSQVVAGWLKEKFPDLNIVYHHAGLPFKKRREIEEDLVKAKPSIDIVVGTDTLSQAVNTAFKTVIIMGITRFTPVGIQTQKPELIRQAMGRAGRPGYSDKGIVIILKTPWEAEVVENALKGIYSGITGPSDYLALVLRLTYLGKDLNVWAKYAYKIDESRMTDAIQVAKEAGLLKEDVAGYKLSAIARVVARQYLPSEAIVPLVFFSNNPMKRIFENPGKQALNPEPWEVAYYSSFILAYFTSKLWRIEEELESTVSANISMEALEFLGGMRAIANKISDMIARAYLTSDSEELSRVNSILDSLKGIVAGYDELARTQGFSLETLIVSPRLASVFVAPKNTPVDTLAETMRKTSITVADFVKELILQGEAYDIRVMYSARGLATLMRAYRIGLRQFPDHVVQMFLEGVKATEIIGKSRLKPNEVVSLYVASLIQKESFTDLLRKPSLKVPMGGQRWQANRV